MKGPESACSKETRWLPNQHFLCLSAHKALLGAPVCVSRKPGGELLEVPPRRTEEAGRGRGSSLPSEGEDVDLISLPSVLPALGGGGAADSTARFPRSCRSLFLLYFGFRGGRGPSPAKASVLALSSAWACVPHLGRIRVYGAREAGARDTGCPGSRRLCCCCAAIDPFLSPPVSVVRSLRHWPALRT